MAVPSSRADFKAYCLRKLGDGVVRINVTDEQVEDRIDQALKYYADYHFDASEKQYYKYQITATDKANGYITLPQNIIGAVSIFDCTSEIYANNMFSIRYQIALNDLYTLTSVSMVPYVMTLQHLQSLEQLLVGKQPIRFNRHMNRLYIDTDWTQFVEGQYLIVECYQVVDPELYSDVWGDRWLSEYATQLIKQQWGEILKLHKGMKLPGGVEFSGQDIYNEATEKLSQLEHEMINSYSLPVSDMIG